MTIRFLDYYKLITESDDFTILSSKKFKGQNIIKTSLFRYKDGEKYRMVITYLKDPSYTGYVEFDSKSKSIVAFNNIDTYDNLIEFMTNHKNDPVAFDFAKILNNEEQLKGKPEESNPFDVVPFNEPGMSPTASSQSMSGPSNMLSPENQPNQPNMPGQQGQPGQPEQGTEQNSIFQPQQPRNVNPNVEPETPMTQPNNPTLLTPMTPPA